MGRFDLELSSKPYQTLRVHGGAVRALAFHKRYPLFASAGDDRSLVVYHGMVYKSVLTAHCSLLTYNIVNKP